MDDNHIKPKRCSSSMKVRKRMSDCLSDLAAVLPVTSHNSQTRGKLDKMEVVQLAVKYLSHMNEINYSNAKSGTTTYHPSHVCVFMKLSEEDRMKEFDRGFRESINQMVKYFDKHLDAKNNPAFKVKLVNHLLGQLDDITDKRMENIAISDKRPAPLCLPPRCPPSKSPTPKSPRPKSPPPKFLPLKCHPLKCHHINPHHKSQCLANGHRDFNLEPVKSVGKEYVGKSDDGGIRKVASILPSRPVESAQLLSSPPPTSPDATGGDSKRETSTQTINNRIGAKTPTITFPTRNVPTPSSSITKSQTPLSVISKSSECINAMSQLTEKFVVDKNAPKSLEAKETPSHSVPSATPTKDEGSGKGNAHQKQEQTITDKERPVSVTPTEKSKSSYIENRKARLSVLNNESIINEKTIINESVKTASSLSDSSASPISSSTSCESVSTTIEPTQDANMKTRKEVTNETPSRIVVEMASTMTESNRKRPLDATEEKNKNQGCVSFKKRFTQKYQSELSGCSLDLPLPPALRTPTPKTRSDCSTIPPMLVPISTQDQQSSDCYQSSVPRKALDDNTSTLRNLLISDHDRPQPSRVPVTQHSLVPSLVPALAPHPYFSARPAYQDDQVMIRRVSNQFHNQKQVEIDHMTREKIMRQSAPNFNDVLAMSDFQYQNQSHHRNHVYQQQRPPLCCPHPSISSASGGRLASDSHINKIMYPLMSSGVQPYPIPNHYQAPPSRYLRNQQPPPVVDIEKFYRSAQRPNPNY